MNNNLNNSSNLLRIGGGSISSILSITSLFANILLILALRKFNPGDCFAFYLINWQLIVADIANQIFFQILLAIPIMFTGNALYGHGIVLRIFGMINTVTYSSTLFFSALMTLNRATVFVAPKLNENLLLGFICTEETVDPIIWAVRQYYRYSPNAMPVIMLFTYITIFVFLKITNPLKNMQNYLDAEQLRKRFRSERSFLIQVNVFVKRNMRTPRININHQKDYESK
uniref:G_PROTEIN_RECEP_F1_2 domain-containing protein n=1 Tax=Meloidogyne hapla TaxID=6305 RepID=A0A1I8BYL9_MELHA